MVSNIKRINSTIVSKLKTKNKMKTLLSITIALLFSISISAQEDCRTKVKYLGYDSGSYRIEVTNKMDMKTGYVIQYPGGTLNTSVKEPHSVTVFKIFSTYTCGILRVKPTEKCNEPCPWDYVETENICGVLPVKPTVNYRQNKNEIYVEVKNIDESKTYKVRLNYADGTHADLDLPLTYKKLDWYYFTFKL